MDPNMLLDEILNEIHHKTIIEKVASRIRYLEHTYKIQYLFPKNINELQEDLISYANHLICKYLGSSSFKFNDEYAYDKAKQLIDGAYYHSGGLKLALVKAQNESFGIIKRVMTDIFLDQSIDRYLDYTLETLFDPFNYDQVEAIMKAYIQRFNIQLDSPGDFKMMCFGHKGIFKSHYKRFEAMAIEREVGSYVQSI